ncbi:MAG: hypothetical protein AAF675_13400 [Pseudomonadota bacterium]
MNTQILTLSLDLQILLASGVLGYFIAFSGYRRDHRTLEQVAFVLIFAAPAGFVLSQVTIVEAAPAPVLTIGLALLSSIVLGIFWRLGAPSFRRVVERNLLIGWDDTLPSAWQSMTMVRNNATQITVLLNDGSAVHCDDLSRFADQPNGPCLLGFDGSIALYITHVAEPDSESFSENDPLDPTFGAKMTFIPAGDIRRVHYRRRAS